MDTIDRKRRVPLWMLLLSVSLFCLVLASLGYVDALTDPNPSNDDLSPDLLFLFLAFFQVTAMGAALGFPVGKAVAGTKEGMLGGAIAGAMAAHVIFWIGFYVHTFYCPRWNAP